ncbi:Aminopyrimidine aminohydrolase [Balamuthia mandrillaris]
MDRAKETQQEAAEGPGPFPLPAGKETLFGRLREACRQDWEDYLHHPFVQRLGEGTLEPDSFTHYLKQDFLFLKHFARAWALAVYKSDTLEEMQFASAGLKFMIEEPTLHINYCAKWGITKSAMEQEPEATHNLAYTRYVLEKGHSGDLLDLYAALAPCVLGYTEIGLILKKKYAERLEANGGEEQAHPYKDWIETYADATFALSMIQHLDQVATARGGFTPERWRSLTATFRQATRLEVGFWQMGLARSF